jgi:hypothetical protein
MAGGGTDVNLAASASASSTSGVQDERRISYGDVILGVPKPTPPYLWIALGAIALVGVVVFLVRK